MRTVTVARRGGPLAAAVKLCWRPACWRATVAVKPAIEEQTMSGTATRRRCWPEVPADLRREAEQHLGSPVRDFQVRPGGFTPGLAAVVMCANGTKAFVKATPVD